MSGLAFGIMVISVSFTVAAVLVHWGQSGVNPVDFLSDLSEIHYTMFGFAFAAILMYLLLAN